jgi:hypothetical protein
VSPYDTRFGYCKCGCGQKTKLAPRNDANRGWVRGQPINYIQRHGARSKLSDEEKFWRHVDRSGGDKTCWPWTGAVTSKGYGNVKFDGKQCSAHVVAWFLTYGGWPTLHILHHCDFPVCCNPKCLFQGTNLDNVIDRVSKNRSAKGDRQGSAKLNDKKIRKIRDFYERGASYAWIARRYNVGASTIASIIKGKAWLHVT